MDETNEIAGQAEEKTKYLIEKARSGASKCKTCRKKISKNSLRLGILVDGYFGPGYLWHHLDCAARRQYDRLEEAYSLESWKFAKVVPDVPSLDSLRKLKEKSEEKRQKRKEMPFLEIAPSGRSRCKQCGEIIEKSSYRAVLPREARFGGQVRMGPMAVHIHCAYEAIGEEDVIVLPEELPEALRKNSTDLDESAITEALSLLHPSS